MGNELEKALVPNYKRIHNEFTEIVAMRLHAIDRRNKGVSPLEGITEGWRERYRGTPEDKMPPHCVELNGFKIEVDNFVAMLIDSVIREREDRMASIGELAVHDPSVYDPNDIKE